MKKYFLLLVLIPGYKKSYSQSPNIQKPVQYSVESGTFLSNGTLPFWHHVNQNGEVPSFQYASLWVKSTFHRAYILDSLQKAKFIDWGGGVTGVVSLSNRPSAFLSQWYLQLKLGLIELTVGRRYENIGSIDQLLSVGNYSFSNNTLPIPKIQIASLGFITIPFTSKLLAFKFSYADGLLGQTQAIPFTKLVTIYDTYFHQKSLYGRIGKPNWRVNFYGGFCHEVMWGGEYQIWPGSFNLTQKERYWGIVRGRSWEGSRIGNHVANLDMSFQVRSKKATVLLYRQNLVEDGSLYRGLSNITDGLNGISIHFTDPKSQKIIIEKGLVELLYTYNQGGNDIDFNTGRFGADNYFNSYIYTNGWSYKNRTLGVPFIAPTSDTRQELPQASANFTNNNRILVLHFGLSGKAFNRYTFSSKMSFSKNSGTFNIPFPTTINQISGHLQIKKATNLLGGSELIGSFAFDLGALYQKQIGIFLGFSKKGVLNI